MAGFGKRREAQQQQIDDLTGGNTIRTALAFGVLGLLGALILAPLLDNGTHTIANLDDNELPNQIDQTVTGSIDAPSSKPAVEAPKRTLRYTIRRSVVQKNPAEPCYIFEDGTSRGGC